MKKFVIFILTLPAVGAGIWFTHPFYQEWKERRFLAQAQSAWAKADYRAANFDTRKVLEINPRNVGASQLMARLAEQVNSPQAVALRRRVVDLLPDVASNRLELACTALKFGNPEQADLALRGVAERDRENADFHTLSAMLALTKNNFREAEEHCTRAAKLDPQNKFARFNLAVLHLQTTNAAVRAAALRSLEQLSADPAHRRDCLRNLASEEVKEKEFAAAKKHSQALLHETNVVFDDRLLHLLVLQESGSAEMSNYLASLESAVAEDVNQLNALGNWLRSHRMSDEALNWLLHLPEKKRVDRTAAELIAECYSDRADWPHTQSTLENQQWGDWEFIRLAQLARACRKLNQPFAAKSGWDGAMSAASGKLRPLYALLEMATDWRWENEREEVAWRIIQQFPGERQLLTLLEGVYSASANTRGLHKVYAAMMKYDSPSAVVKNNFCAVSLLLNAQTDEARETARTNFASHPQDAIIASTYAFALHLRGRTAEGLKLLEKFKPGELRKPEVAIYYGVMLASAGRTNQAREFFSIAAQSPRLLPEEKTLIAKARAASGLSE